MSGFSLTRLRCRRHLAAVVLLALLSPAAKAQDLPADARADSIVILKAQRELQLWANGKLLKSYEVALGTQPVGRKERQGDGRTPEGHYIIDSRNPHSQFHKALHVSYPNAEDRRRAAAMHVDPGGAIMIHGLGEGWGWVGHDHVLHDWTLGCIAVTNEEIDEIWRVVPNGTPVEIRP